MKPKEEMNMKSGYCIFSWRLRLESLSQMWPKGTIFFNNSEMKFFPLGVSSCICKCWCYVRTVMSGTL